MSEGFSIVLTAAVTVIGGVVIYTSGQIISKFFIEPIHDQSRCIGETADALIFYANLVSNPGIGKPEKMDEAQKALRQKACLLRSKTHAIKWYKLFEFFRIVPKKDSIKEASKDLIGLSNAIHNGDSLENDERYKKIEDLLNIEIRV